MRSVDTVDQGDVGHLSGGPQEWNTRAVTRRLQSMATFVEMATLSMRSVTPFVRSAIAIPIKGDHDLEMAVATAR
jgi:hypothetical protein